MTTQRTQFPLGWWTDDLEEVDREIARMAMLCGVHVLDPGVIRRVLKKDSSVCGTSNPLAFAKLHDLIMLHLAIRDRSAEAFGQAQTARVEDYIVERLKKTFPDLKGKLPAP
jgi:hypothetical protein